MCLLLSELFPACVYTVCLCASDRVYDMNLKRKPKCVVAVVMDV